MYSPKIAEDLISKVYRLAKEENKSMTRIVDDILRTYLSKIEHLNEQNNVTGSDANKHYQVDLND